jgi:hypothetical protein
MVVVVVNEVLHGGWLEFLTRAKYDKEKQVAISRFLHSLVEKESCRRPAGLDASCFCSAPDQTGPSEVWDVDDGSTTKWATNLEVRVWRQQQQQQERAYISTTPWLWHRP